MVVNLIGVWFAMATAVTGNNAAPPQQRSDLRALIFTATVTKSSFVLYEPVTVQYRVANPTATSINATVLMRESPPFIEFTITGPDGGTQKYLPRGIDCKTVVGGGLEKPGSVKVSEAELDWNRASSNWAFPVPGKYRIDAKKWVGNDPDPVYLEARPIEIEVKEPSGVDAEAIKSFASKDDFLRLIRDGASEYCDGRTGPACFEELDGFLRTNLASSYAPGLIWNLAESVATGLIKVTPREDLAVGLFKQFLTQWPTHPNAPRVMYSLALVLDKAGRHQEAMDVMQGFERTFPEQKGRAEQLQNNLHWGAARAK